MIKIYYYKHIPKWINAAHVVFATWLQNNYAIEHTIKVHLVYQTSFAAFNKQRAIGFFSSNKDVLDIGLACKIPKQSHGEQIPELLKTFAHEFVHYEQFRDGKKQSHRGVESRAESLVHKFQKYVRSQ